MSDINLGPYVLMRDAAQAWDQLACLIRERENTPVLAHPNTGAIFEEERLNLLKHMINGHKLVLGEHDYSVLRWLSRFDNWTAMSIIGMIAQAYDNGWASAMQAATLYPYIKPSRRDDGTPIWAKGE